MERPTRARRPRVQADGTVVGSVIDTLRTPVQRQRHDARAPPRDNTQLFPPQPIQAGHDQTLDAAIGAIRLDSPSPPPAPGVSQLNQHQYPQVPDVRGSALAPLDFNEGLHIPAFPAIAPPQPRGCGRLRQDSSDGEFPHLDEVGAGDPSSDDDPRPPRRRIHPTSNPPSQPNSRDVSQPSSRPTSLVMSQPASNPPSQSNSRSASVDPLAAPPTRKIKPSQDIDHFFIRGSRWHNTESMCKLCR